MKSVSLNPSIRPLRWCFALAFACTFLASVPAPVSAATCTSSGGVSVVVDFRELGGSLVTSCVSEGGGKSATAILASAGVSLSYATRQPGFVCRVNGAPASDPCINASPADAYWGLWWADGSKAFWTYSSSGAGALTIPAGGSVGWSWQQDHANGDTVPPGVVPPVMSTSPSATPRPTPSQGSSPAATPKATPKSTPSASGPMPSATSDTSPTTSPTPSSTVVPTQSPSGPAKPSAEGPAASTTLDSTGAASPQPPAPGNLSDSSASSATEPTRLPNFVSGGIIGLLVLTIGAGAVVARRRRGSDAP